MISHCLDRTCSVIFLMIFGMCEVLPQDEQGYESLKSFLIASVPFSPNTFFIIFLAFAEFL